MLRKTFILLLAIIGLTTAGYSSTDQKGTIGIVNFAHCITESKLGKQEQAAFEALKTQLASLIEDTEKQLSEIAAKFNDPDYMDGLSPEAEEEMKGKFRTLNEEMNRYQNQYYQILNQANMKLIQTVGSSIQEASERVAKNKKLTMVINKEACFFYTSALDVTNFVISEMDLAFDQKSAKIAENPQTAQNQQNLTPAVKAKR